MSPLASVDAAGRLQWDTSIGYIPSPPTSVCLRDTLRAVLRLCPAPQHDGVFVNQALFRDPVSTFLVAFPRELPLEASLQSAVGFLR